MKEDNNKEIVTKESKSKIISSVKTPLGFFSLTILIVEVILGITANISRGNLQNYIAIGMVIAFLLVIIVVALLTFIRPDYLSGLTNKVDKNDVEKYRRSNIKNAMELVKEIESQTTTIKNIKNSLNQLFPKGMPDEVQPKEWQIVLLLIERLDDQINVVKKRAEYICLDKSQKSNTLK